MDINKLFDEALLAQAAYADELPPGMAEEQLINALKALEPKGLTQAQAEYFASKYIVVQQDNNLETGFSATLFQNIETGEYHLANRGTDGVLDGDWTDANASNSSLNMPSTAHQSQALVQFTFEKLQNEQCLPIREAF
ncbi:hypothetical protein [Litorilituus lipolyticus]|uniref:Uncharacterized protein n=1 Tax=Litorilituus lipolyticus TaxID=2491017 RepID=A0A502KVG0_9GAMM|nr:hypothetical protein [Litorilituus lipolyticus]TPH14225.1 hypothetical protein EPA86_11910 [Litorilituus lipolyticus]